MDSNEMLDRQEERRITITEDPIIPSLDGLTPLHYAALLPGDAGVQIVQLLCSAAANPNHQATEDDSFIIRPNMNSRTEETTKTEFTKSIPGTVSSTPERLTPEQQSIIGGRTALQLACARDYDYENAALIVKALLDAGANPHLICNGHTALTLAIASGNDACIDVLLKWPTINVNQELSHGMGTALSVAAARTFEFRRTTEQRLALIRKLVEIGGASAHHRFHIPPKHFIGNVVDATYLDYMRDRRVGRLPFHALNNVEKEVYEARAQIMDYLADCVRDAYYEIREMTDKDSSRDATCGRKSRLLLTHSQTPLLMHPSSSVRSRTISSIKLGLPVVASTQTVLPHSPLTESSSDSKKDIFYSFCYECGRSAGVRLVPCSRCRLVYYCSKACKLKSWTVRHRVECFVVPALACSTSKETAKQTNRNGGLSKHPDTSDRLDQLPEKHVRHRQNFVHEDGLELSRFLLCRSAGGELLGTWHPAYQYRFILNRYLRVNQRGRIFISKYDGCGNYSLI